MRFIKDYLLTYLLTYFRASLALVDLSEFLCLYKGYNTEVSYTSVYEQTHPRQCCNLFIS